MNIRIGLEPRLLLLVRLQVLHRIVRELAMGFGVSEIALQTIEKGVSEQQLISKILVYFMNAQDECVGLATLTIDWEKHRVRADSTDGGTIRIAEGRTLAEQVSSTYGVLVQHVAAMRRALQVTSVTTQYRFRDEVRADPVRLKEAREFLGTSPGAAPRTPKDAIELDFTSTNMDELQVGLRHLREPKA